MKWILETLGIGVGVFIVTLAWSVWMELRKPEFIDPAIPMLESELDMNWQCAVLQ